MTDYGSNAAVQKYVWGEADSTKDNGTAQARTGATQIINSFLNRTTDITSPTADVTECANLLASGIIQNSATPDKPSQFWTMGMKLLEQLKGDVSPDTEWGTVFTVERE